MTVANHMLSHHRIGARNSIEGTSAPRVSRHRAAAPRAALCQTTEKRGNRTDLQQTEWAV